VFKVTPPKEAEQANEKSKHLHAFKAPCALACVILLCVRQLPELSCVMELKSKELLFSVPVCPPSVGPFPLVLYILFVQPTDRIDPLISLSSEPPTPESTVRQSERRPSKVMSAAATTGTGCGLLYPMRPACRLWVSVVQCCDTCVVRTCVKCWS
jgi:hypothetical protein